MSEQTEMDYYQGRALRERELARASVSATVARIHAEMAEHYEKLISRNAGSDNQIEVRTPAMRFGGR
jgi:hypothetical protein